MVITIVPSGNDFDTLIPISFSDCDAVLIIDPLIMKTLKTVFRKNDLYYTLVCRNDKVALYETRQDEDQIRCHYEVARIYIEPAHTAVGVDFEEAEVLTGTDKFICDGSGAFIKRDDAMKHFFKLSERLHHMPKQPTPLLTDSSLIG